MAAQVSTAEADVAMGQTLGESLLIGAERFPDTLFVVDSDIRPRQETAASLMEDAHRVAAWLQAHGIKPGDVVALQLPNWYETAVIQAGILLCGAIALPIVQIYERRDVEFIVRDAGAVMMFLPRLWRGRDYLKMLPQLRELPALRTMIVVADAEPPAGTIAYDDVLRQDPQSFVAPQVDPDAVALMIYTSGTTGMAKGAQHSHRTLLAETRGMRTYSSVGPTSRNLAVLPGGHMAGLLEVLRLVVHGTNTITMDKWESVRAARLVDQYGVTAGSGAPIHLSGLLDARDAGIASLASLRRYLMGGTAVPPSIVLRADEAGIVAYRSFGMTEHPTVTMGLITDSLEKRAYTDGRPAGENRVRVLDESGADLPPGEDGELAVRGPELFLGYRDPALNAAAFLDDGWFLTGDIGHLDEEGFLTVTDRKKDIIIRAGENIASKEVEDVLITHPRVAQCAVVGAPDDTYGERVCAFVVLSGGDDLTLDEIGRHFAGAGVARQKTPEQVVILPDLPRNMTGKALKTDLRKMLKG